MRVDVRDHVLRHQAAAARVAVHRTPRAGAVRLQAGRPVVRGHAIYVVDLQDGGGWDWSKGEPPKSNPAYYLRFCKSYSRMGGTMRYLQCDNVGFLHRLLHEV